MMAKGISFTLSIESFDSTQTTDVLFNGSTARNRNEVSYPLRIFLNPVSALPKRPSKGMRRDAKSIKPHTWRIGSLRTAVCENECFINVRYSRNTCRNRVRNDFGNETITFTILFLLIHIFLDPH